MPNRLAHATSPYLRQHADNPVDWYPWGPEALALARATRKPILLSIGYSACHWCHVMAHESFEDAETARVMNELFVNIKVDREERPDLDRIYQLAHQALAQRGGGWPLTVFLTPDDQLPFFAGTYFPREPRYGMPPFVHVLRQVRAWHDDKPEQLREQNQALRRFLDDFHDPARGQGQVRDLAPLERALRHYETTFDARHGGFGSRPKFPHPSDLDLIYACALEEPDDDTRARRRHLVEFTLEAMAAGGIHDQLGGGFCRYAVDERWAIPHFEKMLYDNALLLPLFAQAALWNGKRGLANAARGIVDWLDREMRAPSGGYYASLDADSEGVEGRYYVWTRDEVNRLLGGAEWEVARRHYGFDLPPNFEDEFWNPCIVRTQAQVAIDIGITEAECERTIGRARAQLLAARDRRARPGTDDKVLTAWNALLVSGFARAGRYLDDPRLETRAEALLGVLRSGAWREGRLQASVRPEFDDDLPRDASGATLRDTHDSITRPTTPSRELQGDLQDTHVSPLDGRDASSSTHQAPSGHPRTPGFLDDYAYCLDACIEVLRSRFSRDTLAWAIALADALLTHFEDTQHGGFFFTAHDHEALIARPKPFTDDAIPAGAALAARGLLRLGRLIGEQRYLTAALRTFDAAAGALKDAPHGSASLLAALREALLPPIEVVIRPPHDEVLGDWAQVIGELKARDIAVYVIQGPSRDLPGLLAERRRLQSGAAYVCRGTTCLAPMFAARDLMAVINGKL